MKVSIVIPLYNKAPHIARAIDSVLSQSIQDFEVIVVDDGSTDGSAEVVMKYQDSRIVLIRKANGGVSCARNTGISLASSNYIAFLDADDEYLPNFLHTILELWHRFPEAGLYATNYLCCLDGSVEHNKFENVRNLRNGEILFDYFCVATINQPVCSSAVMVPKQVLNKIGGFPIGVNKGEDLHTWVQIALRYPIAWSPLECSIYHLSSINRTSGKFPMEDCSFAELLEVAIAERKMAPDSLLSVKEYLISRRLEFSQTLLTCGDRKGALRLLKRCKETRISKNLYYKFYLIAYLPEWLTLKIREWFFNRSR